MKDEIYDLYVEEKMSLVQVSDILGCSIRYVRNVLSKENLIRPKSIGIKLASKQKRLGRKDYKEPPTKFKPVMVGQLIGRTSTCGAYLYGGE